MSTINQAALDAVKAKVADLQEFVAKLMTQALISSLTLPQTVIELAPGERYAGAVLDAEGKVLHHLVLLAPRPVAKLDWEAAQTWAHSIGGVLPTRQEQALLFANCKPHLTGDWHWSSEAHTSASCAWDCHFGYGYQHYGHKSFEACAVAVRRVTA